MRDPNPIPGRVLIVRCLQASNEHPDISQRSEKSYQCVLLGDSSPPARCLPQQRDTAHRTRHGSLPPPFTFCSFPLGRAEGRLVEDPKLVPFLEVCQWRGKAEQVQRERIEECKCT